MRGKVLKCASRGLILICSGALVASLPAISYGAPVNISYTSTVTPDSSSSSGDYPGMVSSYYLPYTATNSSQSVSSSIVTFVLGSFQTDPWGTGLTPNPTVTPTNIQVKITPTVGTGPALSALTFYGTIQSGDLDFSSSATGPGNTYTTGGTTYAIEYFDNNLYAVGIASLIPINAATKSTNISAFFVAGPALAPEPMPLATMGLAILLFLGIALRRKARQHISA